MPQLDIPCIVMRGGTSRGPYFNAAHLPEDLDQLAQVLISAMGAGSPLQVDGIGGGQPTTSKVAMLSPSQDDWAEVDYFFAQVHAEKPEVDFSPSCGNILAGVGPAALELGLVEPQGDVTSIKIRNVNTDSLIEAKVETPAGKVNYQGDARIDGVPGTAAPVILNFMNVIGSKTGKLFPTGKPIDVIDGKAVTCIDVAMPMMIGRAEDFGLTGYESREEVDANEALFALIEPIRIKAGEMMGFSNVAESVVPKVGLLASPRAGGAIAARYLMPWKCHPSYAVTGSICTGSCVLAPGTVAEGLEHLSDERPLPLKIEHPSGAIDVVFDYALDNGEFYLKSAGLLRTARKLFAGSVCIPDDVWPAN
ncbi:4-oxalomesaconate tautomerase [Pelagibius sp. Alg239-R121]|uniref:4-oxalomesaconate tautomerase n=1 Tax=Pelagibius sp. Alg239-R121 TaxID=2993448 RepID=UPI0024A718DB|nr:4-oxalomesaconate tautomerase [Pelagibius sp. Alg239-R121]